MMRSEKRITCSRRMIGDSGSTVFRLSRSVYSEQSESVSAAECCFRRTVSGDENMANAMWDGERIRFADFEYCGWNDIPRDLSLVTEHVRSYATSIEGWNIFIEQFDLTPTKRRRLQAGRRREALSWLATECLKLGSLHGLPEGNRIEILLDRARELLSGDPLHGSLFRRRSHSFRRLTLESSVLGRLHV
jgi:hypothetical protein